MTEVLTWFAENAIDCIPYLVLNLVGGQIGQIGQILRDWWRS